MANELAASFPGVAVDNAAEMPERATHMLLYLCEATWSDDRLAEQVERVREGGLPIVMAHENDPDKGGCQFSRFFEVTPQERMSHSDARPEPPLPPQPSPPNAAGAHRRRTLQGPGKIVLPGAPPQGARPLSHSSTLPFVTSRAVPARRFRSCFWQRA